MIRHAKTRHAASVLLFLMLSGPCIAQQSGVKITFDAPEGWKGETITLPPGFARNMTLKGIEEIRFAPGMFKAERADFFSYALVFWLPNDKPLGQKAIHDELLKYYQGLATAVGKGKNLKIDPATFKLNIVPIKDKKGQYTATLKWVEPFVTGKPQTLNFEIGSAKLPDMKASYLSMAVSPQPATHDIWKSLRKVIASAKYKAIAKPNAEKSD